MFINKISFISGNIHTHIRSQNFCVPILYLSPNYFIYIWDHLVHYIICVLLKPKHSIYKGCYKTTITTLLPLLIVDETILNRLLKIRTSFLPSAGILH